MKREDPTMLTCSLIELDLAAAEAYRAAAAKCVDGDLKRQLGAFREDHERHVRELSKWVEQKGQKPPTSIGPMGKCIIEYTALAGVEERTAVLAMRGNEEITNETYASALKGQLPGDLEEIVMRGFEDERRHASWLRQAILDRSWDQEPAELRALVREAKAA